MKARSRLRKNKFKVLRRKAVFLTGAALMTVYIATRLNLNPVQSAAAPTFEVKEVQIEILKEQPRENVDTWIGDAVDEFLPKYRSEARMIMHCLAHREAGHRATTASDAHGDGGRAGGGMQSHEATWVRMRNQMIKQGYASEIGSRYDYKEAIRTTAWAIANGRALEWGPLLRDYNGSDFASCQFPSWQR